MSVELSVDTHIQAGGIILAGGRSRRMARNKALLRSAPGQPLMIEEVVARLRRAVQTDPILVTNTPDDYAFLGLDMVPDYCIGAGPLAGIVVGLNRSAYNLNIVVACDMPMLNPQLLNFMVGLSYGYDAVVPVVRDENSREQAQVLHAVYSRRSLATLCRSLDEGNLSLHKAVAGLTVRHVGLDEILPLDPGLLSFRNINTQEDWGSYVCMQGGSDVADLAAGSRDPV